MSTMLEYFVLADQTYEDFESYLTIHGYNTTTRYITYTCKS